MVMPNNKSQSPKDEPLKVPEQPPLPFKKDIINKAEEKQKRRDLERITHKEENLTVEEASILLNHIEAQGVKLKNKLDELYRIRGVSPEYIENYLKNPSNFSSSEWENINKKRRELVDSLKLPSELSHMADKFTFVDTSYVAQSKDGEGEGEGKSKERRKLGGARRGWLPMR